MASNGSYLLHRLANVALADHPFVYYLEDLMDSMNDKLERSKKIVAKFEEDPTNETMRKLVIVGQKQLRVALMCYLAANKAYAIFTGKEQMVDPIPLIYVLNHSQRLVNVPRGANMVCAFYLYALQHSFNYTLLEQVRIKTAPRGGELLFEYHAQDINDIMFKSVEDLPHSPFTILHLYVTVSISYAFHPEVFMFDVQRAIAEHGWEIAGEVKDIMARYRAFIVHYQGIQAVKDFILQEPQFFRPMNAISQS